MEISKGQKVKIKWTDASVFSPSRKDVVLSNMETVGFVEKNEIDYLIIKDPETINLLTNKKHPEQNPTFYFIPKGMIEDIDIMSCKN